MNPVPFPQAGKLFSTPLLPRATEPRVPRKEPASQKHVLRLLLAPALTFAFEADWKTAPIRSLSTLTRLIALIRSSVTDSMPIAR